MSGLTLRVHYSYYFCAPATVQVIAPKPTTTTLAEVKVSVTGRGTQVFTFLPLPNRTVLAGCDVCATTYHTPAHLYGYPNGF